MADNRPHALVTNDDGIDSFFLRVLVEALAERFQVTVAAPMGEQSWIGRAMSRNKDVHMAEYEDFPCRAYALDGTPSDCINIALGHLVSEQPVDLVCSGINIGFNACTPIVLSSGTIAGAIEGAGWGIPSLAFSHHVAEEDYDFLRKNHGKASGTLEESLRASSAHAVAFAGELLGQPVPRPIVHNYNFPMGTKSDTMVERTEPLPISLMKLFERDTAATFRFRYPDGVELPREGNYDMPCLLRGNISYSILDLNRIGEIS
ncbi:5'/3'-nucleotidase SurE [Rubellicoccus peritrichatus]|uniref:5'-nucleotidase n=1 Tax=Rubellicoccus peritrichatus TaxID=3080537 RepID=A0AAQ3LAV5_9BACT|nr:5'/3'-nucleotidase SurE [Puniceicoccus sp. CR14]WOO40123.1 5'/3'-nucleotidase SurE [Puniceicoccus sp. CR14]